MPALAPVIVAVLAQSAFSLALDTRPTDSVDVGFEQLESGQPREAIKAIQANKALESDDPAALINLGNAYARLGQTESAMAYYQAALNSDQRYALELADGRWMDSREAARKAMHALRLTATQAMAD